MAPETPNKQVHLHFALFFLQVMCCGIGLEPVNTPSGEHCKLVYLSQVDLKGELQPKLTNVIMKKQPLCIEKIRKYVESRKPSK